MPLPAGATVGRLPDGTLTWVDATGQALSPDGTPTGQIATPMSPTASTGGGGVGGLQGSGLPGTPQPGAATGPSTPAQPAPAAPADRSARQKIIDQMTAQYGAPLGLPTTVYNKPTAAQTDAISKMPSGNADEIAKKAQAQADLQKSLDSGFDLYTFGNSGVTAELSPDGGSRNIKVPSSATPSKTPGTPDQQMAAAGGPLVLSDKSVWNKTGTDANGKPIYTQTDASTASQALAARQAQADLAVKQNEQAKGQLDNLLAADPNNIALQQQQKQATLDYTNAQKAASDAATAKSTLDQQLAAQEEPGKIAKHGRHHRLAPTRPPTNTLATANKTNALLPTDLASAQTALALAQQNLANNPADNAAKLALTDAQTKYQAAQAAATNAKLNEPVLENTGTTSPTNTFWNPATGQVRGPPERRLRSDRPRSDDGPAAAAGQPEAAGPAAAGHRWEDDQRPGRQPVRPVVDAEHRAGQG